MANIEVFSDGSIVELSAFPCKGNQSALLIWNPESWKVVGSELLLTEDFENTFLIDIQGRYGPLFAQVE